MKASNDNFFDESTRSVEYLHDFLHEVRMGRCDAIPQEVRAAIHAVLHFQNGLIMENEMLYSRVADLEHKIQSTLGRQTSPTNDGVIDFCTRVAEMNGIA